MTGIVPLTPHSEDPQTQALLMRMDEQDRRIAELALSMSRVKKLTNPRTVEPTYAVLLQGLTYLDTVATVDDTGGTSVTWTTFNCAPHHVPMDVEYVVLDFLGEIGTTAGDFKLEIRTKDGSPEIRCAAGSIDGSLVAAGPLFIKVVNAYEGRFFDYQITAPGSDSTWELRLLGFVKRNRVFGTGFSQYTNPDGSGGGSGGGGGFGGGAGGIKPTPIGSGTGGGTL